MKENNNKKTRQQRCQDSFVFHINIIQNEFINMRECRSNLDVNIQQGSGKRPNTKNRS